MNLEGYVTVADRLRAAIDRYPDLRVVEEPPEVLAWPDGPVLLCRLRVYRTPDDPLPTTGTATEPLPGRTPYTRNSEAMVGYTSALGRALGYMGLGLRDGLATADEIAAARNREPATDRQVAAPAAAPARAELGSRKPPSPAQLGKLRALGYGGPEPATSGAASRLIESLLRANTEAGT